MKNITQCIVSSAFCLVLSLVSLTSFATQTIEQRGIELSYDYQNINDGFGNIKSVEIKGIVRNTTSQDASRILVLFRLDWQKRNAMTEKLDIDNLAAKTSREFQFQIDLGQNPAVLEEITAKFSSIRLEKTRQVSPPSVHNIQSCDVYSLTKLTDAGRVFDDLVQNMRKKFPFKTPVKDEFETSEEFDNRMNQLENEHFIKLMDELEKLYGDQVGGKGAIIRFLPKNIDSQLYYTTENSGTFQIPIRLGPYDADRSLFSDVNFNPRTIGFAPAAILPRAEFQLEHKDSLFFLRKPELKVDRDEGRTLRNSEKFLSLDVIFRFGAVQDGPYLSSRAIIEQIQLLDTQTGKIFRTWSLDIK